MSFTNYIDSCYAKTRMTSEEERDYVDEHSCHASADCEAPADETKRCDYCEEYFCADHLYDGMCRRCFEIDLAADELVASERKAA